MDCSILVVNQTTDNETNDSFVTLHIYPSWDRLCWLSSLSKIIYPGETYLYRSEGSFKFEIKVKVDKKKMKTLCSTRMWEKDTLFKVTGSYNNPKVEEKDLSEYPQERQVYVRRKNMENGISVDCGRNLYEILQLNMKEVRGKKLEEQNEMIKKAYHRAMRRWHPDRNPEVVDDHICKEINVAYDILRDPEKRARYNNAADYNNGWLSASRWKSIFRPECHTKKQKKEYRKRMLLMLLSGGLVISGAIGTFLTGGVAAPVAIVFKVLASSLISGGFGSALRTISREAIKCGFDLKKYFISLAFDAIVGALTGGVGHGIAGALEGIGDAVLEYVTGGAATQAVGEFISLVFRKIESILVSGKDVSWKELLGHPIAGRLIGGKVGVAGGAVGSTLGATAGNVDDDEGEKSGERIDEKNSGSENGEENPSPSKRNCKSLRSALEESKQDEPGQGEREQDQPEQDEAKQEEPKKEEPKLEKPEQDETKQDETEQEEPEKDEVEEIFIFDPNFDEEENEIPTEAPFEYFTTENIGRIRYLSEGPWVSKMIVEYVNDQRKKVQKEVIGSGKSIELPETARDVQVRFQVMRFPGKWCDVKKYDRINKCWCKPAKRHNFKYETSVIRTFTIGGPLYYEAVIKVTGEFYDDLDEM